MIEGKVIRDGRGLAGVAVSDGLHVTKTAEDGGFSLPGYGHFVFLTRPSGYTTDDWFSPAEGGPITFEVFAENQPVPFSFAQVTDLHLSLGDPSFGPGAGDATIWFDEEGMHDRIVTTPAVLDELLRELAAQAVRFVVGTGDLTNNGTEAEYVALRNAAAAPPVPLRLIPGNHDHHSAEADLAAGGLLPWEHHIGPRWYSFDYGGVHFAAIDWFTHLLGIDSDIQEQWLDADLAAVGRDVPVVLLTHDQMGTDFFDRLRRLPIASFSGHWHTTRAATVGGTRHYNTGPATFGGLDYSPASYRLCTWDGADLSVTTVARGDAALASSTFWSAPSATSRRSRGSEAWSTRLNGGTQFAAPVITDGVVLATSKDENAPRGFLAAFDLATGDRLWQVELGTGAKASPVVAGSLAIAASASGEVVAVEIATGEVRWRSMLDDPLLLWLYHRPALCDGALFLGDVARFSSISVADGSTLWTRTDLGQRENLTSFVHPAVVDGTLLVGFAGQVPPLWGLDPATGATRWPVGVEPGSMYRRPSAELVVHLPQVVVGGVTADPGGKDAYVVRLGSRIERLRAGDGSVVWSAPLTGWFNPAPPLVSGDAVIAVSNVGEVHSFDRESGTPRWSALLPGEAPVAMGSYRASGPVLLAAPVAVGDHLLVAGGDGRITALSQESGDQKASYDVGVPMAAAVAVDTAADLCVVAPVDGRLRAIPLAALGL